MTLSVLNTFPDKDYMDNRIVNFSVLLGNDAQMKRDHYRSSGKRVCYR